ncbi:O-antigen/teichoic acid export membrane protein [Halanaerobium congolense]|uniref:O-antigen/teichoic acid export membrane protein n=1 Tax=Halanaerobium congolense TaxID=54121 RepID=A0A4R8GFH7_9FIRM|nr:MOP flippase family protein [Halanaerobium congolense]TDX42938.1 O-antigen/teichoic acid export membrane protein [Halanaerobium congolense]
MSLKKKTFWGGIWNSLSSVSLTGLNFIITAILARLLSPNAFGVMGMIQTTIALINMMNQFGLSPAIIQGENLNQRRLSSLFWFNMFVGITMTGIVFFSADLVALFFNQNSLAPLLRLISIVFTVVSFSFIQQSLLRKEMKFKELFNINIISTISYGIITIILAVNGFGVKSLVLGYISKNIVNTILIILFNRWVPSFRFDFKEIKDLLNFGVYVFGSSILNYFNRNLDYLLIGRFLGSEALGYYTLAYKMMLIPVQKIGGVISNTFLPAFSQIKHNQKSIKKYYLKVLQLISLLTFPMMGGLFIVAPEFILSIYGENWIPVIILIQILSITGALQSLGTTLGTILLSQGRSDISFKWNLFAVSNLAVAMLIGMNWGIIGVAAGVAIFSFYAFWISFYITGSLINMSLLDLVNFIKKSFLYTIFMMIIVYLTKTYLVTPNIEQMPIQLAINVITGIVVYAAIFLIIDGKEYFEQIKRLKSAVK